VEKGTTTYVALDAHKGPIMVAMQLPGETELVEWETVNEPSAIRRMVRKVEGMAPGEIRPLDQNVW
jgi:hypothetical protein